MWRFIILGDSGVSAIPQQQSTNVVLSTGEVVAAEVSGVGAEATVVTSHSSAQNTNNNLLGNSNLVSSTANSHTVKGVSSFKNVFKSWTNVFYISGGTFLVKDKFKCLYLLVETAVAVHQREKEQEDDIHVLGN